MSRVRIGALRQRVVLEAPSRTADGGGGASESWASVAEVWASVRPLGGDEAVAAERVAGRRTHEIVIRRRPGVELSMRFRHGSRLFEIAAVLDLDDRGRFLKCLCRERDL